LRCFNQVKRQFPEKIDRFRCDISGEYINIELKDIFLTSAVIYELTLSYSLESNGIVEQFNQTINTIVRSMTIAVPDIASLVLTP
jgi:hypothetical protein